MSRFGKARVRRSAVVLLLLIGVAGCQQWSHGSATTQPSTRKGFLFRPNELFKRNGNGEHASLRETPAAKMTPKQEADIQYAQARVLESDGELAQASVLYLEVIKRDKTRADALHRLGIIAYQQAQFEASNEWFHKAIKAKGNDAEICCDFGYSLYGQGRLVEAESMLKSALQVQPDHPRAHNNLGLVYAHSGQQESALDQFRLGGASQAQSYSNVALALALDGDLNQAKQIYHKALELDANCQSARRGLNDLQPALAKTNDSQLKVVVYEE